MRGLPFPSNATFDRETSYEYGTPFSNVVDIPIDPALAAASVIDPAIMAESSPPGFSPVEHQSHFHPQHIFPGQPAPQYNPYDQEPRQYSQGPQGDPFAPQPPAPYLIVQEPVVNPNPKPAKRKRKPRREEECGFCQGNDNKNKEGVPEVMVTCVECGRSGHPSCMELGQVSDVVRSYDWKCIECKICEICHEKGDDERILFCDFCDRGWHMDCLQPSLDESPPGKWHCPMCPPPEPEPFFPNTDLQSQRAGSVASPSNPVAHDPFMSSKAAPTDESEEDTQATVKQQKKGKKKGKARARKEQPTSEEDEPPPTPVRIPKQRRLRIHSPVPPPVPHRMIVRLKLPTRGKGKDRDDDEEQKSMFDDILGPDERDTSKTTVDLKDKDWFEKSRQAAERKIVPLPPAPIPEPPEIPIAGPSSRPLRSSTAHLPQLTTTAFTPGKSMSPLASAASQTPKSALPPPSSESLRIRMIRFGEYDIQTWYDAPFPEEYSSIPDGRLWICEFCLKYMKSRFGAIRHRLKCKARHPPGDEIYRDGAVSIFEVDGRKNKIYCQNLCLLSKMFLDHKSLFYDVEPFLFYVMSEVDEVGARFVGYFSKEKRSPKDYNVSCIMTLPVRQRKGWGNLLIDFSYLLSKKEQRLGSPEKPLSGLGALGYKNYWTLAIMRYLDTAPDNPRLEDISAATSMTIEDVHTTLIQLSFLRIRSATPPPVRPSPGQSIKFPKGRKNGIARKHLQRTQSEKQEDEGARKTPFVAPTQYEIRWDRDRVRAYLETWAAKGYLTLRSEKLKWSPFLLARTRKTEALEATEVDALGADGQAELVEGEVPRKEPDKVPLDSMRVYQDLFNDSEVQIPTQLSQRSPSKSTNVAAANHNHSMTANGARSPSSMTPRSKSHSVEEVASSRYTRSRSSQSVREKERVDESIASDEAFAAKLAREERARPRRQLRSRSDLNELKRAPPIPSPGSVSLRKRRRIGATPDAVEIEPSTLTHTNGILDGTGQDVLMDEDVRVESGVAGQTPRQEELQTDCRNAEQEVNRAAVVVPSSPATVRVNGDAHMRMPVESRAAAVDGQEHSEVKSEDMGTPLTGLTSLTSRHSVPSDDTIAAEVIMGEKVSHSVAPPPVEEEDIDAEGDIDADGDIDAEGDPDVEVVVY